MRMKNIVGVIFGFLQDLFLELLPHLLILIGECSGEREKGGT
jgi:hypothetical protein